ncbi:molybdopterin molybdotransferase MoeA [Croceitalea sp. P059]|uniref:molybdopterin molybdotransferase MoeA n=1 Tax=Croceitalea sp. P059 TaxID=3075601 RepID=UPI0028837BE5|nr:molybdopterin molybdotransferase MoeA [Croceitalea sp. P059]MDT0539702.1 molybdopterin molybdotransferase MoeA [Croceitalea sp. P059]
MIAFEKALELVLNNSASFGEVTLPLDKAVGRILAEDVFADRDFPPFNRATKDGIAIHYESVSNAFSKFKIQDTAAAGSPQLQLFNTSDCIEVMTGAMVPINCDTVIMYEYLVIESGFATLLKPVKKGQNIHVKGSDEPKGVKVLERGIQISASEIGVLASVGKAVLKVKKNPRISIVSTGDELVNVHEFPKAHQIRKSNSHTLKAALIDKGIASEMVHIPDEKVKTKEVISKLLLTSDVILLSGGVSKGKYDYLPEVFEELNITKVFHKVKQRPGKPFWFGSHEESKTTVFGFPGNPVSTFANFNIYFLPWLDKSLMGVVKKEITVILEEEFENTTDLTRFIRAKLVLKNGKTRAQLIEGNGSGDLTSLTKSDGFLKVPPNKKCIKGAKVSFLPTRRIL